MITGIPDEVFEENYKKGIRDIGRLVNNLGTLYKCINKGFTTLDFKALAKMSALYQTKYKKNHELYGRAAIRFTISEINEEVFDDYVPHQDEYPTGYDKIL